jgi:acylphosphatase
MSSTSTGPRRVVALYQGRVQGVGFRYSTARLAGAYAIEGYVMNLSDGAVRVEAEGDPAELERFLEAIRESELGPGIRGCDVRWSEADGRFTGFRIRYQTLD